MKLTTSIAVLLINLFILPSCSTISEPITPTYKVEVDSMGTISADKKSFVLIPANKGTSVDDLQFKEFAAYVTQALIQQDFQPATNMDTAKIAIVLGYGKGHPLDQQYEFVLPTSTETQSYMPEYASSSNVSAYNDDSRYLLLGAIDLDSYKSSKKSVKLWEVFTSSRGLIDDLRQIFPVLTTASSDYIADKNGSRIKVTIAENDDRISAIKGKKLLPIDAEALNHLAVGRALELTMKDDTKVRGNFLDVLFTTLWIENESGQKKLDTADITEIRVREE